MRNINHMRVWDGLTDEQRRAILDEYIMTSDIPSNVSWELLDYGTKSAICFTGDLEKFVPVSEPHVVSDPNTPEALNYAEQYWANR